MRTGPQAEAHHTLQSAGVTAPTPFQLDTSAPNFWGERRVRREATWADTNAERGGAGDGACARPDASVADCAVEVRVHATQLLHRPLCACMPVLPRSAHHSLVNCDARHVRRRRECRHQACAQ